MLWVKRYYKHFMLVFYVRNKKIRSMGDEKKKREKVLTLLFLTEKSKERKEERLKRFDHACN